MKTQKATFGAGCFWHVEEEFRKLEGILKTAVGYMGGKVENPSYESVCTDTTGHVEVCQVEYDPDVISYDKLLQVFWKIHNPTQLNRQGPDVGSQYKSVIFYYDQEQMKVALASKEKVQKKYKDRIATEIIAAKKFYEAEEYHQKYLLKKGRNSC